MEEKKVLVFCDNEAKNYFKGYSYNKGMTTRELLIEKMQYYIDGKYGVINPKPTNNRVLDTNTSFLFKCPIDLMDKFKKKVKKDKLKIYQVFDYIFREIKNDRL